VRVYGTFSDPNFELKKGPLVARAGAMAALAVTTPLAALIPLIEPGPGQETDCGAVREKVRGAARQANATPNAAPRDNKGSRNSGNKK
jgi:hypothetical protein